MSDISFFAQLTLNGILLGVFYATMALGFSTIWGVMRLINLAHGEFLLMAAYVAWFFYNPTREGQSLIVGGGDPEEVGTVVRVIFGGIGLMAGVVFSETYLIKRIHTGWLRVALGVSGGLVVMLVAYTLWHNSEYKAFEISVMNMVMIGLGLSIGFILSHFVLVELGIRVPLQALENIWIRRAVGYPIGLFIAWLIHDRWQASGLVAVDPFVALPMVLIMFFSLGYILQKGLFNQLVEGPYLTMLLVTFGVKIILQNFGLQIYAADPRKINVDYALENWSLIGNDLTLPKMRFFVLIMGAVIMVLLMLFYKRTRVGYAIRAAAQHKMAARLIGIDIQETYAITFGVALAITAAAGVTMGTFTGITPVSGDPYTLRAFSIVALGGFGRTEGVLAGGLVLGLVESYIGGYINTGLAITAAFSLLVIALVVRPQGITGGLQPEED